MTRDLLEEAIVATLAKALPNTFVYPLFVPEHQKAPFIVYREVDSAEKKGHYTATHTRRFAITVCAVEGLEPEHYRATKALASDVEAAFSREFRHGDLCVYRTEIGKRQDQLRAEDSLFWLHAVYSFTYDTLN